MKRFCYFLLFVLLFATTLPTQSCSRKSGCPAYETTKTKTKRGGELRTKRGSSNLFPKKMRRGK
jgi:hypothetical protein